MERHKIDKRHRKKVPRVPIKTYKWEDIRRARLRGGYPWTYLYKEPFDELIDPKPFTMEAMQKSKSSSPLPKSTERLDIKDVTEEHQDNILPEPSGYIVITEVPSDSENHSKKVAEGSVTIEDVGESEAVNIESAESSDNISQYLDKEEPVVEPVPSKSEDNGRQERAKSEEPKRKRKLSIDSSYSRKSLSKLAIMKKLKEAKDKIKVPSLPLSKKLKPVKSKKETKEPSKNVTPHFQPDPNQKPVYIHIPLKPPEGESDEFSYLEFGEKKPEEAPKLEPEEAPKPPEELPTIQVSDERRFSGDSNDIVAFEIVKSETIDLEHANKNGLHGGSDYLIIQNDDKNDAKSGSMIIIMPQEEEPNPSPSSSRLQTPSRQGSRKERAKSAEPERKRKLSIDSSYSRRSLSKLGLLKKFKDAKDKFKFPKLSKKEPPKKVEPKEPKVEVKKNEPQNNEPKYIHIPLKPPPGQSDEFSYLEYEENKEVQEKKKEEVVEQSSIESPPSPKAEGVQFIFLTPPSDDEILKEPEVPETPSSETTDESRINELKMIAQDAVEKASPTPEKKVLQPVTEEESIDEKKTEEKMVVDEEDGLKLTESAMAKQEQNIKAKEVKSSLKTDSPVLKKKVSFKRRSRDESKDGDYEDVQAPSEENVDKTAVLGNGQSMSVDEEKSYLDEKIIKSTSLEEDYNRWSKLSDHEYEPVNPPPDDITIQSAAPPTVHVIDTDQGLQAKTKSLASSTTSLERRMLGGEPEISPEDSTYRAQDIQSELETKYFAKPETTTLTTVTTITTSHPPKKPKPEGPGKFQQAIKTQTDRFKTKLHEMKKPNIKLPSKPNFKNFNLPKMPDTAKINLPSFSLPRRNPVKRSLKQRQFSTESNAGDSKTNYFDFRTYPRLFKKKQKDDFDSFSSKSEREVPEFATVPRTKRNEDRWGGRDSIRIPLHSEDSMEDQEREDSVERRMASHIRYDQDIDIDDAYEKENQEIHSASPFSHDYNSRWNHGSFHPDPQEDFQEFRENPNQQVTDLDSPIDKQQPIHDSFDTNTSKDIHSSESSLGIHRRGVLEEIDSDEFFLRQKGISQDNIEVGMYLSSEIREAFKSPNNALFDLQYETRASNTSLPETPSKRKAVKKPKRKKTPHVSQEQVSFDQDSELESEAPPSRPKRRSKRSRKKKEEEESVIPYQETIAVEEAEVPDRVTYENEQMQGKEQPEIKVSDPYAGYESEEEVVRDETTPMAPPRKHRSLKSLNYSEHDSILGDFPDREPIEDVEIYKTEHEYIIPAAEEPPVKPARTLSRSSSKSNDKEINEPPVPPTRSRSRTRSRAESLNAEEPCVEELCVQDFRDYMGYAVIDKNTKREPPLPPPKTPPRRKRSVQSTASEQKFFTVPRPVSGEPPVRPLRNYSTLGPSRPPRKKHPINMTDEEKENIDITQYIEIDDEPNRDLHSGEVIQKMKDRPLPAPPRPPRNKIKALQDVTSQEEVEVSIQTEPLPDEEVVEQEMEPVRVERHLITPTHYTYEEETITHGSLVVEPLNGAKILPDHELSRMEKPVERTIPITKEEDEETSEVPEEFHKLKDPPVVERPMMVQPDSNTEVEVLKAQKLQVTDLDVDRLNVNELLASRIVVSEIDSGSIQTDEIASKSGALKIGEIELPPSVVQQLLEKLQAAEPKEEPTGQKKNSD